MTDIIDTTAQRRYSVGGVLYDSRSDAIRAAIEWWGTACGTQPLDLTACSADELRELAGWCVAPAGVDQEALDAEVIATAAESRRVSGASAENCSEPVQGTGK